MQCYNIQNKVKLNQTNIADIPYIKKKMLYNFSLSDLSKVDYLFNIYKLNIIEITYN